MLDSFITPELRHHLRRSTIVEGQAMVPSIPIRIAGKRSSPSAGSMEELNLPPAAVSWQGDCCITISPPNTCLGHLGPSCPGSPGSPGSDTATTVAFPLAQPPLPPIYSPRSSMGSSCARLSSSKNLSLINVVFEIALDRQATGDLTIEKSLMADQDWGRCW